MNKSDKTFVENYKGIEIYFDALYNRYEFNVPKGQYTPLDLDACRSQIDYLVMFGETLPLRGNSVSINEKSLDISFLSSLIRQNSTNSIKTQLAEALYIYSKDSKQHYETMMLLSEILPEIYLEEFTNLATKQED